MGEDWCWKTHQGVHPVYQTVGAAVTSKSQIPSTKQIPKCRNSNHVHVLVIGISKIEYCLEIGAWSLGFLKSGRRTMVVRKAGGLVTGVRFPAPRPNERTRKPPPDSGGGFLYRQVLNAVRLPIIALLRPSVAFGAGGASHKLLDNFCKIRYHLKRERKSPKRWM